MCSEGETGSKKRAGADVHYIAKKSDINIETNNPRYLRCSRTSVQVDRVTDFPSTSKRFGKGNQKMTRFCRAEGRQTDGETLFLYFLLSR